jgi:3-isopropylmalate/(R)-2-methylmalate dehydratase small subunit
MNDNYVFQGRVWAFGDNISTDLMMPGYTLWGKVPDEEMPLYCMRAIRPEFAQKVKPGDIVVGGKNFGNGSSRPAARNFKALGITCIIADSFSPIFFRNTINLGMPLLSHPNVTATFNDGDEIKINANTGFVQNLTTSATLQIEPIPELLWEIIEAGDLFRLLGK